MKQKLFVVLFGALVWLFSSSATPAQSSDLMRVLPDDSGVAVIDVKKVIASELWGTAANGTKARGLLQALAGARAYTGLKPEDLEAAAITFHDFDPAHITVAVRGSLHPETLVKALKSDTRVELTSEKQKEFEIYTICMKAEIPANTGASRSAQGSSGCPRISMVFFDDRTAVIGPLESLRSAIDVRGGSKPAVGDNAKLTATLALTPQAAVRFATVAPSGITAMLPSDSVPLPDLASVKAIFGTVEVTSGIEVNATLRNDTAEHAKLIADQFNGLLAMGRGFLGSSTDPKMVSIVEFLKSVSIVGADVDVKIGATLPKSFLADVIK